MKTITDQAGNEINMKEPPERIVSVVPSITELLYDLGLAEQVVAITKFCVHPQSWFRSKNRIGGTKALDIPALTALLPQLIIASKEENVKAQIDALQGICPVYVSDVKTLEDALQLILDIGLLTGSHSQAAELVAKISLAFCGIQKLTSPLSCCYFIWQKPYMVAGGDTFISNMLLQAGFQNVFINRSRYPEVSLEEVIATGCRIVMLSSEPFPFAEKHLGEINRQLASLAHTAGNHPPTVLLVDGEMFSWYGSRLLHAPAYFAKLLMPSISC